MGVISGGEPSEPADRPNEARFRRERSARICDFAGDS